LGGADLCAAILGFDFLLDVGVEYTEISTLVSPPDPAAPAPLSSSSFRFDLFGVEDLDVDCFV